MRKLLVIGLSAAALPGCGGSPETGPVLAGSPGGVVWAAATAAEDRLGASGPAPFTVSVELVDRYGNESAEPALSFDWSDDDLSRINRDGIGPTQLVDLATVTILSQRGVIALAEWCDPENGPVVTDRLCGSERRRAEEEWTRRSIWPQ